jgi:hypothetical protein
MYLRAISFALAAFMFLPGVLPGQEVYPTVDAVDPTVNSRVQDPDKPPIGALLPGGSSAWSGQPIMSQTPSAGAFGSAQKPGSVSKPSPFPSLVGLSIWGQSSSAVWAGVPVTSETPTAGTPRPAQRPGTLTRPSQFPSLVGVSVWGPSWPASSPSLSSLNASGTQGQTGSPPRWAKTSRNRKLDVTMANINMQSAKSGNSEAELLEEAIAVEENRPSDFNSNLRVRELRQELKQATARAARLRVANTLQSKADASSAGRWAHDASSAGALGQQQHETGMLLKSGFNARSDRQQHRHKAAAPRELGDPGSR